MAETLTIRTANSTDVVKIASVGPQGPKGDKGDPGDVAGLPLSTQGDLLYRGASENQRLGIGSSGQVLKVSGGIPAWANESGAVSSVAGRTGAVTLAVADVSDAVPTSRSISSGTGLTGGGDLTANRTLAVSYGSSAGTACQGNDARLSDSRTPTAHAASHAAGVKASFSGQVAGMTENVFIRANNVGTAGNSITLTFDGVDDIDTVLAAWNAANTSNTAELVLGDGSQVPDNLEEITLSGGVAAGSDPLSFREISVTDPVSAETYTLKSGAPTTAAGNSGFGIYSESSESFPFLTSPNGEVIFAGAGAFLGVADRTNTANRSLDKGVYGLKGCLNVYSQSLGKNTVSFGDNGDVLVGQTDIGTPEVVAGVSSWGKKFQVNGNVTIRDNTGNETATFDAQAKLTANRTYDLPNRSGELMIVGDAPASHTHGNLTNDGKVGSTSGLPLVTTTAGAVTTLALGTANQVLRTKSDLSGVEFADPAAAGVTSVTGTAPIVSSGGTTPAISVTVGTGANTVAAGNDSRITGAIQSTLVDAKGDLIVATAADTVARLPVGATNGHVLTVDSAEAGGMKWAAAAGGTPADNSITNAKLSQVSTATIKGRTTAGTGNVEDLSASDARTVLGLATTSAVTFASLATSPAANTAAFTTTGYSLTGGNAQSLVDLAGTWNTSGTPSAIKLNVTDTASNASSLLMQLQTGGTNRFTVSKTGAVTTNASILVGTNGNISTSGASGGIRFYSGLAPILDGSAGQVILDTDADYILALKYSNNANSLRIYATHSSSTNYQRMSVRSFRQTLSALSGASATTTGTFIPDGAVVVGVTTRVATALTGAAGYTIGDGTDADRWGDITGTAIGTTSDNRDWTAGTIECFTAGGNITLTAKSSNFTAGAIEICVFYLAGEAD